MMLDAWSRVGTWKAESLRLQDLAASQESMTAELDRLEERNSAVARQNELVMEAMDRRLPPVPARFLAYLGSIRPPEMQFTDFNVSWDPATAKWSFRLEGQIEGDEELGREGLASFQRLLVKSPLRARFNDSGRSLAVVAGAGSGIPTAQRFALEGGLFED
jgi:hypothetical protein